ncbi:hypothetical protein BIY24_00215 [Halobacteriovorax marinus]|uniref:Spy/CpxP family protein refolding chaperone n=1 Tax=Halobacteriovorax marinus TaxID=97084 RepID=UPI000BC35F6E|nr:Spy/CpxP family protein refolding chaperone [Halobacteriovorax marinus]ATH06420.1 hypothetical protein BIY24_00215 [Halobacteriovorax marinus]
MKSILGLTLTALLISTPALAKKPMNIEERQMACKDKSAGDSCTLQGKKGEKSGTCKEGRRDKSKLICLGERKGKGFGFLKELNLSKEQFSKLKEHKQSEKVKREERKALKEKIKSLREDIKKGFIGNISDDKMMSMHKEVSSTRAKLEEMRFSKMIAMKNILNEEQRKKFIELEDKRREKFKKKKKHHKKD